MRFNLKALFVLVTCVAVALAWWKSLDAAYWVGWREANKSAEARCDDLYLQWLKINTRVSRVEQAAGVNPYADIEALGQN